MLGPSEKYAREAGDDVYHTTLKAGRRCKILQERIDWTMLNAAYGKCGVISIDFGVSLSETLNATLNW